MSFAKLPVLSLSAVLAAAALTHASVEVRAKADQTHVYKTEKLEPPPISSLYLGEPVTLMFRGADRSMIRTEEGLVGWVLNIDLQAVRLGDGGRFELAEVKVEGSEVVISPHTFGMPPEEIELAEITRSFSSEIVEPIDREQTEMRHDEN